MLRIENCYRNEEGSVLLNVLLAPEVPVDIQRLTRHVFASSSCGLCGKATVESIHAQFPPVRSDMLINAKLLATLPQKMRAAQETFDRTGGLHAAALFDAGGRPMVLREDVGRYNAVDKVVGHCLLHGSFPPDRHVLLVSGRSSFEITHKVLAARVTIFATITSSLAKAVNPFRTSENARDSGAVIAPASASTAGMGTKVTGSVGLSASVAGFFGLTAQTAPIGCIDQPAGSEFKGSFFN